MLGFLAVGLLVGAAQAEIGSVDIWFVASLDSASGTVSVESELCMSAFVELIDEQGFEYRTSAGVSLSGGQQGMAYLFTRLTDPDTVTMVCTANRKDLFGPGGPGGPGGPF
jgi:hypothetical protein